MEEMKYRFIVRHPDYDEICVEAQDRLHAIVEAAHIWGVLMWTSVARECETERMDPAKKSVGKRQKTRTSTESDRAIPKGQERARPAARGRAKNLENTRPQKGIEDND